MVPDTVWNYPVMNKYLVVLKLLPSWRVNISENHPHPLI
jgi:hypothetical protein